MSDEEGHILGMVAARFLSDYFSNMPGSQIAALPGQLGADTPPQRNLPAHSEGLPYHLCDTLPMDPAKACNDGRPLREDL
jgi:hypothetical protein